MNQIEKIKELTKTQKEMEMYKCSNESVAVIINEIMRLKKDVVVEIIGEMPEKKIRTMSNAYTYEYYRLHCRRLKIDISGKDLNQLISKVYNLIYPENECTLADAYTIFINRKENEKILGQIAADTVRKLRNAWTRVLQGTDFAKRKIEDITLDDLNDFIGKIAVVDGMTDDYLRGVKTVINGCFEAVKLRMKVIDPSVIKASDYITSETLEFEKNGINKKKKPFTKKEAELIYKASFAYEDQTVARAVRLLFWVDCRIGELKALTWDAIDFEKRIITLNKSIKLIYDHNTGENREELRFSMKKRIQMAVRQEYLIDQAMDLLEAQYANNRIVCLFLLGRIRRHLILHLFLLI